jgi:hypothetical protein
MEKTEREAGKQQSTPSFSESAGEMARRSGNDIDRARRSMKIGARR